MLDAGERNPRNRFTVGIGALLLATALILNFLFERHTLFESWGDLFFPAICFLLLVTGVVILIGGLARSRNDRLLLFALPIVVSLTILYIAFYAGMQFVQTGGDRLGECPGLYEAAASANVIPTSCVEAGFAGTWL